VSNCVHYSHAPILNIILQLRYTDTHVLSRQREISIKSSPMSLVLSTTAGKSHLLHLVDTPGHVNFVDEVASVVGLVDGIVLVVDVVEGVGFAN
jgi:116 kDa U5 small nuclear ribonucleoprotein component